MIEFRVNTLPSRFGEKVCLRLLDSGATQLGLDKLIDDPDALALVRELGSKPFGMILVTGPTGSGKSTTLYSLLAERNDPGINISTVEAGEAGGVLDEALKRLAKLLEDNAKLQNQIKGALGYPIAVLVIAILVPAAVQ